MQIDTNYHPIQKKIIKRLLTSAHPIRFSDFEYVGTSDDEFTYHLKRLLQLGIVDKKFKKYCLTEKGIQIAGNWELDRNVTELFRVSVIVYVVDKKKSQVLLHRRKRSPYLGDVTTVSGKVMHGELVVEAAKRKVREETGLEIDPTHLGVLRKIRYFQGKLFEDVYFNVCYADSYKGELIESSQNGDNYWGTFDELLNAKDSSTHENSLLSLVVIKKIMNSDFDKFFFEEKIDLKHI